MSDKSINDKTKAEIILEEIENHLRSCLFEKKKLEKEYQEKVNSAQEKWKKEINEVHQWMEFNRQEADKIVNKLILLWDYWNRECEIFKLEKKTQLGVLPSEREKIIKEICELNKINVTLEKAIKERRIEASLIDKIKKKLVA